MRVIFSICFFLIFISIDAQSTIKFYAQTDARKIVEGSYVEIDFVLENASGSNFTPPSFKDFTVISGPNKSTSMSITNGSRSQKMSLGYALQAKKIGRYKIGPATITTNKGRLQSQEILIEVVKGTATKVGDGKDAYVMAEISDSVTFVGQQIILDYKLYTVLDVRNAGFISEPSFDGFYNESLRNSRSGYAREVINGQEYYTKSIKKVALFPQQTGTYEINAVPIELGIASNKKSRSLFFSTQLIPKRIMSNPLTIIVKNAPQNDPYFSGAVGQYTMSASTPKKSLTTDEAIVVLMKIIGNGDSKTVLPPIWKSTDSLEVYDPNIVEDEVLVSNGEITHRKTFEYLLVPKIVGRHYITANFSYYNPDSLRIIRISKKLPRINVLKGSNKAPIIQKNESENLEDIYSETKFSAMSSRKVHNSLFHYLGLLVFFLIGSGIYLYSLHLKKTGQKDPDAIRKNKAFGVAQERLKLAHNFLANEDSKGFHEELTLAIKKYLTDKYKIPALHIKKDELIDQLRNHKLHGGLISKMEDIFDKCEIALYAPGSPTAMNELYTSTVSVISDLEE